MISKHVISNLAKEKNDLKVVFNKYHHNGWFGMVTRLSKQGENVGRLTCEIDEVTYICNKFNNFFHNI